MNKYFPVVGEASRLAACLVKISQSADVMKQVKQIYSLSICPVIKSHIEIQHPVSHTNNTYNSASISYL